MQKVCKHVMVFTIGMVTDANKYEPRWQIKDKITMKNFRGLKKNYERGNQFHSLIFL